MTDMSFPNLYLWIKSTALIIVYRVEITDKKEPLDGKHRDDINEYLQEMFSGADVTGIAIDVYPSQQELESAIMETYNENDAPYPHYYLMNGVFEIPVSLFDDLDYLDQVFNDQQADIVFFDEDDLPVAAKKMKFIVPLPY